MDNQYIADAIAGFDVRLRALEIDFKKTAQAPRSSSTLLYADCEITINWRIPPRVDSWIEDFLSVTVSIGQTGQAKLAEQTHDQYPDSKRADFDFRDVGIESAGTWWLTVAVSPVSYKLNGITYPIHWLPRRRSGIPEDLRDVSLSLGRPREVGQA